MQLYILCIDKRYFTEFGDRTSILANQHSYSPLSLEASGLCTNPLRFQVICELPGHRQPGSRKATAAAASSMVCLHPGAVTFSCVRSMNYLLSFHHSCTCMAFARLGGEFCQAQHLLLIVDK
ncbi:hypothetical protein Q5P01_020525 [Channa striata]|uniref:Uncharacterized protein n=1 Tax=Channa striata TaxID=64152 RepID=A0AA88LXS9_CHASR|nr:hypothetical protein Q5P01_020525 [Channa striata]